MLNFVALSTSKNDIHVLLIIICNSRAVQCNWSPIFAKFLYKEKK